MNKQISSKTVSLVFAILVLSFAIGFYIFAWTEPSQSPPNCPSGQPGCDAPVNIGGTSQTKSGALGITGVFRAWGGAAGPNDGLTVSNGNIGIGTTDPSTGKDGVTLKLDVEGRVGAEKYCDKDGNNCKSPAGLFGGCEPLHAFSPSEFDSNSILKPINVPGYCMYGSFCYIIIIRYKETNEAQNIGEVNKIKGVTYTQASNGIWMAEGSDNSNDKKNGDSDGSLIVGYTSDNIELRDDIPEKDSTKWTYRDGSGDDAGELIVCKMGEI